MATLRERWLGDALAALRTQAGLSVQDVTERTELSNSTIQRIERAAYPPKKAALDSLLQLYGPTEDEAARIRELWRTVKTKGWWSAYGDDVIDPSFPDLESAAHRIRTFQNAAVPGLLQTEDYAYAVIDAMHPDDPGNAHRIDARARRRSYFNTRHDPPELHAILDEAVLLRQVGSPGVMRDQISYLRTAARRPNVTLQIVPFTVGAYGGMAGPFVILSFDNPDYPDVVYVESRGGDVWPEGDREVTGSTIEWDRLTKAALSPEDTASLLNHHLGVI